MTETIPFDSSHPFVRILAADKARGVIIGGALGDALGLYTEFQPVELIKRSYPEGIVFGETELCSDSHRDKFTKGSWTDDTDHALLLVLAVLQSYGETHTVPSSSELAHDFAKRLNIWCKQGLLALSTPRLGLGQTIGTVALHETYLDDPAALAKQIWTKSSENNKPASNGSLMRAHPLGIIASSYNSDDKAFELALDISKTTHADPRCSLSCCTMVIVVRGLLRGEILNEAGLDRALDKAVTFIQAHPSQLGLDLEPEEVLRCLNLEEFREHTNSSVTFATLQLDAAYKIGYVYKCLGSAILCLRLAMRESPSKRTYSKVMRSLIMQGGDADTNGAVAGALLGAWLGEANIPEAYTNKLNHYDWLHEKAVRFVYAARLKDQTGESSWHDQAKDTDADIHGGRKPLTKEELEARDIEQLNMLMKKREVWNAQHRTAPKPSGWMSVFRK